jgi:hypothetical protein
MIKAYPLQWPEGWPRTKSYQRKDGRFKQDGKSITIAAACSRVLRELEMLGIVRDDIVISTNVQTRMDGLPRSDRTEPSDTGTAVYWQTRKGMRRVMAIDQYASVADNLAATAATLEAMRAIDRHGGAQILDRAFTGFTALPAPGASRHWRDVLGVEPGVANIGIVRTLYRALAMQRHPDRPGGSHDAMTELNAALAAAEKELS